jgi:hypothetical protein
VSLIIVRRSTSEILSGRRGAEEDLKPNEIHESVTNPLQGELMAKPGEHVKFTLLSTGTPGRTKEVGHARANSHNIMSVLKSGEVYIIEHEIKYTGHGPRDDKRATTVGAKSGQCGLCSDFF